MSAGEDKAMEVKEPAAAHDASEGARAHVPSGSDGHDGLAGIAGSNSKVSVKEGADVPASAGEAGEAGDKHDDSEEGQSNAARDGLGLSDVAVKPAGSIERDLETAPTLLPAPPLSPHPADALHAPDSPTTSLITVLRDQLRLLSDQSAELNAKLVASISKHADLLDTHEALSIQHAELSKKADGLAQDKRQWEESMKTGLLVERSQITLEMQRLASGLVEEERRRGSAEERRRKVEDEVDELAASLFDQANTMVAQERHGRIEAEERLKSTEENLLAAEAAMRDMQVHLQSMPTASAGLSTRPATTTRSANMDGADHTGPVVVRRHLSSHVPYTEYLSFLAHLRSLRPLKETSKAVFPPPSLSALASQPFLARITVEDHEPTLRLEAAPDLSWLSRRSVTAAILSGDLIIEPVPASQVLQGSTGLDVGCAMCGKPVFPGAPPHTHTGPLSPGTGGAGSHFGPPPQHPNRSTSGGRFSLKPFFNATSSPSNAPSPTQSPLASPALGRDFDNTSSVPPTTTTSSALPAVYVFRIAKSTTGATSGDAGAKDTKAYPLCRSGWCLERLRATCELWHFLRAGLVGIVWAGDDGYVLATEAAAAQHVAQQKRQSQIAAAASPAAQTDDATAAKRSSAPVAGEFGSPASVHRSAAAADVEPPRRKSAWGLGFKWKSGSTSTTGASSSGSAVPSPPSSPRRLPPPIAEKAEVAPSGLGAPLELGDEDKGEESPDAPALPPRKSVEVADTAESGDAAQASGANGAAVAEDASGEAGVEGLQGQEQEQDDGKLSVRPDLSRQASASSFASAHETFATASAAGTAHSPESATGDVVPSADALPDTANQAVINDNSVELSSPVEPAGQTQFENNTASSEQETSDKSAPPPIPRRAAGRPKSVIITKEVNPATGSPRPDAEDDPTSEAVAVAESTEPVDVTGGPSDRPVPPLPARPPKTPLLNISSPSTNIARTPTVPDGEKAFLPLPSAGSADAAGAVGEVEEDSWEAKSWRQIVKLKEAMWKARVGVVDEAD